MSNENKNNNLPILVAGIIIGAAATYLLTTENGKKIKDKLMAEGAKLLDKMQEGFEEVQKEVAKEEKKIEEKVAPVIESAREQVEDVVAEVPQQIAQIQKKSRRFFFSKKHASES